MADRPMPEDPSQQPPEGADAAAPPAPTEPLPPSGGPGAATPPAPTAQHPPVQPAWTAAAPAGQHPGQGWAGASPAPARPSTARRLWGEATATTGSRIALATAAVLGVVLLLAGIGLVGSVVVHRIDRAGFVLGDDDDERGRMFGDRGRHGDTPFGNNGRGNGRAEGRGDDRPGQGAPGRGRGAAEGLGGAGGFLPGLGTVLHGQFTTTLTGEPAVMVFQVGEVTGVTDGERFTVRSTDGFEATYTLDARTTDSSIPATGDLVRVVAAKDGMRPVVLQVLGADD